MGEQGGGQIDTKELNWRLSRQMEGGGETDGQERDANKENISKVNLEKICKKYCYRQS